MFSLLSHTHALFRAQTVSLLRMQEPILDVLLASLLLPPHIPEIGSACTNCYLRACLLSVSLSRASALSLALLLLTSESFSYNSDVTIVTPPFSAVVLEGGMRSTRSTNTNYTTSYKCKGP
jgi:hypothetical protein